MILKTGVIIFLVVVLEGTVSAITPFKMAFDQKYVKQSDSAEYKKEFRKIGCNVCHIKGKKRDWLNAYGIELSKLIAGNAEQRLDEAKKKGAEERKADEERVSRELEIAFDKVAMLKSPDGMVYDELFKSHKFPTAEGARSLKETVDDGKQESE